MRAFIVTLAASALLVSAAAAQDRRDDRDGDHRGDQASAQQHAGWGQEYGGGDHHWRRGEHMGYNDWSGAQPLDYRSHHLRRPPHGYEWRETNGQYVLAAVATGVIASIILNGDR